MMEWYSADFNQRISTIWLGQGLPFDGSKLKEIMLVARPAKRRINPLILSAQEHNHYQRTVGLPRDVYGFVNYEIVREDKIMFPAIDSHVVNWSYDTYASALKEIFPKDSHREIKIRRVVDIDYESIGQTDVEGENAIYTRTQRE